MRTTIDVDAAILRELKRMQKREGKALGALVSELVAQALASRKAAMTSPRPFTWLSRPMGARVNLADKDAMYAVLDLPDDKPGRERQR
jgi:hypothetical protein